jgi:hypothetical protein
MHSQTTNGGEAPSQLGEQAKKGKDLARLERIFCRETCVCSRKGCFKRVSKDTLQAFLNGFWSLSKMEQDCLVINSNKQ